MRRMHRRRGGAAVEFGVTLPFILFIFQAGLEYGWLYTQQAWVVNAVRDVARFTITLDPSDEDVEDVAETRTRTLLQDGFGFDCTNDTQQCQIQAEYVPAGYDDRYDVLVLSAAPEYRSFGGLVPVPDRLPAEMTMLMITVTEDDDD